MFFRLLRLRISNRLYTHFSWEQMTDPFSLAHDRDNQMLLLRKNLDLGSYRSSEHPSRRFEDIGLEAHLGIS